MAEVEMSRKELVEKLANLAYASLKEQMYVLKSVAKFTKSCKEQFGLTMDETKQIVELLTAKVMAADGQDRH